MLGSPLPDDHRAQLFVSWLYDPSIKLTKRGNKTKCLLFHTNEIHISNNPWLLIFMVDLHIIFVGSFVFDSFCPMATWAISGLVPHVITELPDKFTETIWGNGGKRFLNVQY